MKFPCMLHGRIVDLVRGNCVSGYVCPIADMTQTQCQVCNQMHGYLLTRIKLEDMERCPCCGRTLKRGALESLIDFTVAIVGEEGIQEIFETIKEKRR